LTFSSLTESKDGSGWLIRIYNPNKISCSGSNIIKLRQKCLTSLTNFTGEIINDLGLQDNISVGSFAPGEIKTIKLEKGI
jgi:mannosylglycerate hydrolase